MASLVPPVVRKTVTGFYGYLHAQTPSLANKVIVITGGTNGIGLSLSRTLYTRGASLYVLSSSRSTAEPGLEYIKTGNLQSAPGDYIEGFAGAEDTSGAQGEGTTGGGKVEWIECDMEDLTKVAQVAKDLRSKLDRLDVFAGIAGKGTNAFSLTKDGYDSHLTMNNLAHHVLLSHLFGLLKKTAEDPSNDVRIVQMSSELHRATLGGPSKLFGGDKFRSEEEFKQELGPDNLYARTKLGVLLFTKAIVQRFLQPPSPILAYATHPGAVRTGQQDQFKPAYGEALGSALAAVVRPLMRRPDQGSLSALWSSVAVEARDEKYENGTYFTDPEELGGESSESNDQELIDNFFDKSESIIKKVAGPEGVGPW